MDGEGPFSGGGGTPAAAEQGRIYIWNNEPGDFGIQIIKQLNPNI